MDAEIRIEFHLTAAPVFSAEERRASSRRFGQRLIGLRHERGLSQGDLARYAYLCPERLRAFEAGERDTITLPEVFALAIILDIGVETILPGPASLHWEPGRLVLLVE